MDALSRVLLATLLLMAAAVAGCGGDDAPDEPAEPRPVTTQAPALPEDVFVQLAIPETGELYRIAEDGRFLVTNPGGDEQQQRPISRYEPGRETVSDRGLERLREALEKARFFSLPERIETGDCVSDDVVIRNSGRKVLRRTVVVSARDGDRDRHRRGQGRLRGPVHARRAGADLPGDGPRGARRLAERVAADGVRGDRTLRMRR